MGKMTCPQLVGKCFLWKSIFFARMVDNLKNENYRSIVK